MWTVVALILAASAAAAVPGANGLLAFERHAKQGCRSIYVSAPTGKHVERLTRRCHDSDPAFSPDGKTIAFVRSRLIHTMSVSGKHVQRVTTRATLGGDPSTNVNPSWSPSGNRIVFARTSGLFGGFESSIYSVRPDGTGLRELTRARPNLDKTSAVFSPDGERIAVIGEGFRRGRSLGGAYQMSVADGQLERFYPAPIRAPAWGLDWSPRGNRIVFAPSIGGIELFAVNADGSMPQRLTDSIPRSENPAYSPDGSTIVFELGGSLATIPATGGTTSPVFANRRFHAVDPAWAVRRGR